MRIGRGWTVAALLVMAGCASGGTATPEAEAEPVVGSEIRDYTNIYTALRELRPSWIRRAREVFVDDEFAGSINLLRRSFSEEIRFIELVPPREVVRRFGPCQAPAGTGVIDTPRDPQCGTRPVIHIVRY